MKSLLVICFTLAFCLLLAPQQASALTNVSTCVGTLYSDTVFKLTADLSNTNTTPCIIITGVTGGGSGLLELNCDGHSISHANTSSTAFNVYVHDNDAIIWVHDCVFNGYTSQDQLELVRVLDNTGNDINRNFTGPSVIFSENTYSGGKVNVITSPYFWGNNEHYTNAGITCQFSNNCRIWYNAIDLTGTSNAWAAAIYFNQGQYLDAAHNTITGNSPSSPPVGKVDDGIVFECDENPPTQTCIGSSAYYNTITDMWDAGIEWGGHWSVGAISNNTITNVGVMGIGCFGAHDCSVDNMWIDSNAVTAYSGSSLFYFDAHNTRTSFFTNNTLSNNTIDVGSNQSYIGKPGNPFTTFSGNYITDNHFGAASAVTLQQASGVTDGSGNYCYTANYAITCH